MPHSTWLAPLDGAALHVFEVLQSSEYEQIKHPGVVILAKMGSKVGTVREVKQLANDAAALLTEVERRLGKQQIHWLRQDNPAKRAALVAELTVGGTRSPTRFK